MRDAIFIFIAIILAIVIGGYLVLNGTSAGAPDLPSPDLGLGGAQEFVILAEGQDAGSQTRRTNYRITSEEQFAELWDMVYTDTDEAPSRPVVDFNRYEVIAIFDGSHSTGGYDVSVTDIEDADGKRTVHILRESPGAACMTTQAFTSPFQIVRVEKTALPIGREEAAQVNECA